MSSTRDGRCPIDLTFLEDGIGAAGSLRRWERLGRPSGEAAGGRLEARGPNAGPRRQHCEVRGWVDVSQHRVRVWLEA